VKSAALNEALTRFENDLKAKNDMHENHLN